MDARAQATAVVDDLSHAGEGPPGARVDELLPLVYDELRGLARAYMRHERGEHTLEPTALVHEAYLRLVDQSRADWRGRSHFFAVGAGVMRRLLIDHARRRGRAKRGGGWRRVTLSRVGSPPMPGDLDPAELLTLNRTLEKLERLDERQARIVELRFFGGLTVSEVAFVLGVSKRTVEGDWTHARAWLAREVEAEA